MINSRASHKCRFEELENMQEMGSTRINSTTQVIGTKPKKMRIKYDAPTIWTTICTIIDEFGKGLVSKMHDGIIKQDH